MQRSNAARRLAQVSLAILMVLSVGVLPVSAREPVEVVQEFQRILLDVMKHAQSLGYRGRYERLKPAVLASHDIPFVARVTVGKHWKQFSEEERALFLRTFEQLSVAAYAGRFDDYHGEHFRILGSKPLPRGKVLVETVFTKANGEQLRFDYVLRKIGDTWRIINITVDGVSDLAVKRAEYTTLVKEQGFTALIEKMNEQISRYANGG